MITDKLGNLAVKQALKTGVIVQHLTGATIDLGGPSESATPGNIGESGQPAYIYVSVSTDIVSAAATGTVQFRLVSQAAPAAAQDAVAGTHTIHAASPIFAMSNVTGASNILPAGTELWKFALPKAVEDKPYLRYLGLTAQATGSGGHASGAIDAKMTFGTPEKKAYASGEPARS